MKERWEHFLTMFPAHDQRPELGELLLGEGPGAGRVPRRAPFLPRLPWKAETEETEIGASALI